MASAVIQTGSTLQLLDEAGGRTVLTLPTGVTLRTDVPPRWVTFNKYAVLVNTPSQPLTVDASGTVRLLTPRPPRVAPILAGVSGGTLTGQYVVKDTFVTLDASGNIISESDYSALSTAVAISGQFLGVSNIDTSPDSITLRRLYRTTNHGAVFFQWVDLDGNVLTTTQDDLADAGLSVFAAPVLGTPPRLTTIAEFRGRLFGPGDLDIDNLRYTETGVMYAWPTDNLLVIPGVGSDSFGISALAARREALGVGRRNNLTQITGTGIDSGSGTDFEVVIVSREVGIESQETTKVFRDVAYFLWKDGVYTWGPDGITCVSDGAGGRGMVRSWFTTNDFFNRDKFTDAFAVIDPYRAVYKLFLCSAGSDVIDHWVEYDIDDKTWFGPHKTGLFTPTSAFTLTTSTDRRIPVIGAAESVFEEQATRTDGFNTPIDLSVIGKQHDGDEPDQNKLYGEMSVFTHPLDAGVLTVTSRTGKRDETGTVVGRIVTQNYDMTKGRIRLGRPGNGEHCQISFRNANAGEDVQLYGYEVAPVFLIGRR